MITITVYPVRTKPFNLINFYRQWQVVDINGMIPGTKTVQNYQHRNVYNRYHFDENTPYENQHKQRGYIY